MSTPPTPLDLEIARLEGILNSGTTGVSSDGESVSFDLGHVRQRLEELKSLKNRHLMQRVKTWNISKAF